MKINIAAVASVLASLFLGTLAQAQGSLEGAWQRTEVRMSFGPYEEVVTDAEMSLILFSQGHYSIMRNLSDRSWGATRTSRVVRSPSYLECLRPTHP